MWGEERNQTFWESGRKKPQPKREGIEIHCSMPSISLLRSRSLSRHATLLPTALCDETKNGCVGD